MEALQEFLLAYKYVLYTIFLSLATAVMVMKYWEQLRFWWLCTWSSFPVIGKIARLSKDTDTIESNGWFSSEMTLCSDFYAHYDKYDKKPEDYEKCTSYLSKVDELGRSPFPIFMWIVIFVLVALEAAGFSYVLAGFTIPGASELVQQYGAMGIALIIAIILVGFTHWTGHEVYKNTLIKKIRVWYKNDRNDKKPNLEGKSISIDNNSEDDNEPNYIKVLNRVNVNATVTSGWIISIITAILVVSIAIGATYVRGQVLEKQLTEEVTNVQTDVYSSYPSDLIGNQEKADTKALEERQDNDRKGGWATFIVLAILFIFIQLLGVLFGFKWGFVGRQSLIAYMDSHQFKTKQEFINYYEKEKNKFKGIAQQKLRALQQKMSASTSSKGTSAHEAKSAKETQDRTFSKYAENQQQENQNYNTKIRKVGIEEPAPIPINKNNSVDVSDKKVDKTFCSDCGHELNADSKFCPSCGVKIELQVKVLTCPECKTVYEDGVKFCNLDGNKLELA